MITVTVRGMGRRSQLNPSWTPGTSSMRYFYGFDASDFFRFSGRVCPEERSFRVSRDPYAREGSR
jgi:hypothetical protein